MPAAPAELADVSILQTSSEDAPAVPPKDPQASLPLIPDKDNRTVPVGGSQKPLPINPPVGKTFQLHGTGAEVYITNGGIPEASKSRKMVILLTNSLGLGSSNNLYLADRFARSLECLVAVPDLFEGDPVTTGGAVLEPSVPTVPITAANSVPESAGTFSFLNQVKTFVVSTAKGFLEDMWSARHTFSHTLPIVQDTASELLAVYKPARVAIVGYSFGAKYVLHLLSLAPPELPAGYDPTSWTASDDALREADSGDSDEYENIVCGVVVHPSSLDPKDFTNVAKPAHLVYGRDDELLPDALVRKSIRELEASKRKNGHVQGGAVLTTTVFDNERERKESGNRIEPLPHGFAVPGDYPKEVVGDRPNQVFDLAVNYIRQRF
jgi:dienelactone hydrolase